MRGDDLPCVLLRCAATETVCLNPDTVTPLDWAGEVRQKRTLYDGTELSTTDMLSRERAMGTLPHRYGARKRRHHDWIGKDT